MALIAYVASYHATVSLLVCCRRMPRCLKVDQDLDRTLRTALGYDLYPYAFPAEVREVQYWWNSVLPLDQIRVSLFHYLRDSERGRETREDAYPHLGDDIRGMLYFSWPRCPRWPRCHL